MQYRLTFLTAAAGILLAASAHAYATDPLIEGAKLCTRHLPRYERENGIPTHLLSAIASTESGRYHEGLKIKVPWPWTINAEGKGYFFDSKAQAIAAVRKLQARGVQSIDIGCMQVNIHHHPDAFSSLDEAFEPQTNVAYAAGFLRNLYQEDGSWRKAAADYHSKTPILGGQYVNIVYNSWYQILEKLRAAKQQVPETNIAMNEGPTVYARRTDGLVQDQQPAHATITPASANQRVTPIHHAPHMNMIQVGGKSQTVRDNGILIIRPETQRQSATVAAAPAQNLTVAQAKPAAAENASLPDAKVIHINATTPADATRKAGPNFIFND